MKNDIDLILRLEKKWRKGKVKIKRAGGQTNRNYIIEFGNNKYFVRLPWERGDVIDRKVEGKNILALSKCEKLSEILPQYYIYVLNGRNILSPGKEKFNLPDGTMMTEYIEGKIFKIDLFNVKKYQEELARAFYIFHASGVRFANKYDVFRDEIGKYKTIVKKYKYPIQKIVSLEVIGRIEEIEKEAKSKLPLLKKAAPAHNDFIFQNFILGKNGKVYLLDFEYAGLSERGGMLYDFGFLFTDNLFRKPPINQKLFEEFLKVADKIYKKNLDRKQIYWLALSVNVMQFWWALLRYFSVESRKEKKYFREYILKRTRGIFSLFQILKQTGVKEP